MTEFVLLEAPSIFRWNGAKQGRTMFSATGGRLLLTDHRLVFSSQQVTDDIPLGRLTGCELTGRMGNLTVHLIGPTGAAAALTFGTQQLGMPIGQQWVSTILAARDASTSRAVLPAPGPGDGGRVWAAQHGPYHQLMTTGVGPRLRSWRVADIVGEDILPPSKGRIEIWRDIDSMPPIAYLGLVALYQPDGALRLLLGAEVAPDLHHECYLGAFVDGVHHNLGADPTMRDPDTFARWGVGIALGHVEGDRQQEPATAAPSPDQARQMLRELGEPGAAEPATTPQGVAQHLAQAHAALTALGADTRVLDALARASRNPVDPAALHSAGAGLMSIGLDAVAAPALVASLDRGGRDPDTVNRLALCRSTSGSDAAALEVFRRHAWSIEHQSCRESCAHHATMCGDLPLVRELLGGTATTSGLGILGSRVQRRLDRADALGRPPSTLRDWVAVLHGSVLLHSSLEGGEAMNGRYAAVWDNPQRLTDILTLLEWTLVRTRRRPRHVVTWPDRSSVILGHLIRERLGVGEHAPGDDGTTLVVRYFWTDDGGPELAQYRDRPSVVLFAYGLDWTTRHELTPDVVGLEAQMLMPSWDGAFRLVPDAEHGWRQEPIPPDEREPETIAAELAATTATMPAYVHQDVEGLDGVVAALQRSRVAPGLLGGTREPYVPGGPVTSNRFV